MDLNEVKMTLTDRENSTTTSGQGTFLHLPVEVREMIYHLHLTSERILPRNNFLTGRWTPIDLLYVSRTIYNEAFFHLYTRGDFVLEVRPESISGFAICWGFPWMDALGEIVGLERFVKNKKILPLIRHITLDIHWPTYRYSRLMDDGTSRCTPLTDDKLMDSGTSLCTPLTDDQLTQNMARLGTMLSPLPVLRTIDVSWSQTRASAWELEEISPPIFRIPQWLRGLKQVRRRNERVLIRMPRTGPVSTEELARDQEDGGEVSTIARERREDREEFVGYLREKIVICP